MATVDHSKPKTLPKFDHRIKDLRGQRFERLTVTGIAGRNKNSLVVWECVCDCGNKTLATSHSLTNGVTRSRKRSCGCLAIDVTVERSITHGMTKSPEYQSWRSMIERCENKNATSYENYGGRGIKIYKRWRESFEAFFADMGNRPKPIPNYQIERNENDGNYEPSNCRWATIKEQANNRRQRKPLVLLTFDGETLSMPEWAEKLGIAVGTIHHRRWQRMPIEKVLSTDLRRK